jgi:hypothetical protein
MRLFRRGPDHDEGPDWPVHEARAGYLAGAVRPYSARGEVHTAADGELRRAWVQAVRGDAAEVVPSLLMLLMRRAAREGGWSYDTSWRVPQVLGQRRFSLPPGDAAYALRAAAALPDRWHSGAVMATAARMAAWCAEPSDPDVRGAVVELTAAVGRRSQLSARHRGKIMRSLAGFAPPTPGDGPLDMSLITSGDGWSAAVLDHLGEWAGAALPANLLLRHLASAAGSKPAKMWLAIASDLLRAPEARGMLKILLECAVTADPVMACNVPDLGAYQTLNLLVSWQNADLLRAACWAAGVLGEDWAVPVLQSVARRAIFGTGLTGYVASAKVPNACIHSLGMVASTQAIAGLQELDRTVKHAGYRKQVIAALAAAAQSAGLSLGELAERTVPDGGLNEEGERVVMAGGRTARLKLSAGWRIRAEWQAPRGWARTAPAATPAGARHAAKLAAQQARAALAGERNRLEKLLAQDRSWALSDWQTLYLGHPITGSLARGLIWAFDTSTAGRLTGMPADSHLLDTLAGQQQIPPGATVRLWHPARAGTAEVQAWRDHLVAAAQAQPFKQAFREVYLRTPAELQTRLYSNRFAAHILHYRQAHALFKQRGWTANFLGPYDGGYEGHARRDFAEAGLSAIFHHYLVDTDPGAGYVDLCTTDRVSFCRTGDRRHTPVPLEEIPELVFTEALRDVDLFVSVTSIALDPHWADRGDDPHYTYWRDYSFGELSQTAAMRREALARLLPKLKIAPQLELGDRHLRVKGKDSNYKIHIGSANILIEPDDRYLCIVPGGGRTKVMLPFEDDHVLSVIVSKAVLLAADDKITDPAIRRQLNSR